MHPICFGLGLLACCLMPPALPAQQDLSEATVTPVRLTSRLHVLHGPGGNVGVSSGPDGIFLIDDQFAPVTDKIRAAIATFDSGAIRFVLNTHWHGDHTGGNENLGSSGTIIVAQDEVRTRMSTEQFLEAFNQRYPASPAAALPVVTFSESVTFHLNGETIYAFHVPAAHTDGDAVIYFRKDNVIHGGDAFFNGIYPFIDVGSGGSVDGVIAAADRMLSVSNDSTRFIPGHGPVASRADLTAFRAMLAAVQDRVKAAVGRGESLAQVQAARPTAEFDAAWGKGFLPPDQFVAIVYASARKTAGR